MVGKKFSLTSCQASLLSMIKGVWVTRCLFVKQLTTVTGSMSPARLLCVLCSPMPSDMVPFIFPALPKATDPQVREVQHHWDFVWEQEFTVLHEKSSVFWSENKIFCLCQECTSNKAGFGWWPGSISWGPAHSPLPPAWHWQHALGVSAAQVCSGWHREV